MSIDLENSVVAVVGIGALIGEPISNWLEEKCKELIKLDSQSDKESLGEADIIISGVGRAGTIDPSNLKEGAGVIDFGYSYEGNKVLGDLLTDNKEDLEKLKFYTGTPGGTGPILVAKLYENFYKLCGK